MGDIPSGLRTDGLSQFILVPHALTLATAVLNSVLLSVQTDYRYIQWDLH